jgi:hypothetical protein
VTYARCRLTRVGLALAHSRHHSVRPSAARDRLHARLWSLALHRTADKGADPRRDRHRERAPEADPQRRLEHRRAAQTGAERAERHQKGHCGGGNDDDGAAARGEESGKGRQRGADREGESRRERGLERFGLTARSQTMHRPYPVDLCNDH